MPLPHSGVGETLTGADAGGNRAAGAHQETLFGISPGALLNAVAARGAAPAASPTPRAPAAGSAPPRASAPPLAAAASTAPSGSPPAAAAAAAPRTMFGVPAPGAPVGRAAGAAVPPANPAGTLQADAPVANRTLIGVMPEGMAQAVAAARERTAAVAPRAQPQPQPQPQPRATSTAPAHSPEPRGGGRGFEPMRGGTMVGASAVLPQAAAPAPAAAEPQRTAPARGEAGTVRSVFSHAGPAPVAESLADDDVLDAVTTGAHDPAPPMHARTALGVAIPGIAPLRAGASHPAPAATRAVTQLEIPRHSPLEETRLQPDSMSSPPTSLRTAMPRGAFVLLGSGLVLLLAAAAFALLWKAQKPLSVAISADASGKDRLDVVCEECPDGTLVSLSGVSAPIEARKAYLALAEPLPLGENRVTFGLQRPDDEKPRDVELTLPPVEYRIRPNTSTLSGDQPRLTLEIAALPGSKVEIARQPVALDPSGKGEISVDLGGQLIGPASEVVTFEQAIGYVIAPPSGKVYEGELAIKIGVTPLLLEAPGLDTVTELERFMLAGRTTRGAELWVAGTAITVDSAGRFSQLMSIDSVGETRVTVRATEPGLAPRFVSFRLQRVDDLQKEATSRRQSARPLAEVSRNIADHIGSTVQVTGRVEEVRVDGHRTLIILQADGECAERACLARLVYGGLRKLARGEAITAIGRLQGGVGGDGAAGGEVPEVDVSLLL